jgi:hypothetical protein
MFSSVITLRGLAMLLCCSPCRIAAFVQDLHLEPITFPAVRNPRGCDPLAQHGRGHLELRRFDVLPVCIHASEPEELAASLVLAVEHFEQERELQGVCVFGHSFTTRSCTPSAPMA